MGRFFSKKFDFSSAGGVKTVKKGGPFEQMENTIDVLKTMFFWGVLLTKFIRRGGNFGGGGRGGFRSSTPCLVPI